MRRVKLNDERGRVLAGFGGLIALVGAVLIATAAFSTDTPSGNVRIAEASHDTVTQEELEEFDAQGNASVTFCHTEGSGDQHVITTNINAFLQAGHFSSDGNPLHQAGSAH